MSEDDYPLLVKRERSNNDEVEFIKVKSPKTLSAVCDIAKDECSNQDTNESNDNGSVDVNEDRNREYCNICKDGGELLCCDRCPRAFHLTCLKIKEEELPNSSWYCKFCSIVMDRRKKKIDDATLVKRLSQENRLTKLSEKTIKKKIKSQIPIERKAILELREELDKLCKEEREVKRRLDQCKKKRKHPIDDTEIVDAESNLTSRPAPLPYVFEGIEPELVGRLLCIWDFVATLGKLIRISRFDMEQFRSALLHPSYSVLLSSLHISLICTILEDREDDEYVSDEDNDLDEVDRLRFELKASPLSIGVPTYAMLNFLSWPAVLLSLITSIPRFLANSSSDLKQAVESLKEKEYPLLCLQHKLTLLSFLLDQVYRCRSVRDAISSNMQQRLSQMQEYSRFQSKERRQQLSQERQMKGAAKTKLKIDTYRQSEALDQWLLSDHKNDNSLPSPSPKSATSLVEEKQSTDTDKKSRHETPENGQKKNSKKEHKKTLKSQQKLLLVNDSMEQKEEIIKKTENDNKKEVKDQSIEGESMQERERVLQEMNSAIVRKDISSLKAALKEAHLVGLEGGRGERSWQSKEVQEAYIALRMFEEEAAKENELLRRAKEHERVMSTFIVRTLPLGLDRDFSRYWWFSADRSRILVEKPILASSSESYLKKSRWYYYDSLESINDFIKSLDTRGKREYLLKVALEKNLEEIRKAFPKEELNLNSIPSPQGNETQKRSTRTSRKQSSFVDWVNKLSHKKPAILEYSLTALIEQFLDFELKMFAFLKEKANDWEKRRQLWIDSIENAVELEELSKQLLILEEEFITLDISDINSKTNGDNEDEEDDGLSDAEGFEDPKKLWPTQYVRKKWYQAVEQAKSISQISIALASFQERCLQFESSHAKTKSLEANRSRKLIKTKRKNNEKDSEHEFSEENDDEWEEMCCICTEGGELICCDGCPKVFHLECKGLRRIPRGKVYCPSCKSDPIPEKPSKEEKENNLQVNSGWDNICGICKCDDGKLFHCNGCPKSFHLSCLQLKESPKDDWFCKECKIQKCGACKKGKIRLNSHVICGSEDGSLGCENVFHLECVNLTFIPEEDWYCDNCRDEED